MINPTKRDIGRKVLYLAKTDRCEEGVITSMNDLYVFVKFSILGTGQACNRKDLTWISEKAWDKP